MKRVPAVLFLADPLTQVLAQAWVALCQPFGLVPFAMLYLRARQAEGTPLPAR
jgi:hypothetical protein